jgi:hypothetical protein
MYRKLLEILRVVFDEVDQLLLTKWEYTGMMRYLWPVRKPEPVPVAARSKRRGSAAARLLRLWVRIPPGHGCLSVVSVMCCQAEVSSTS